MELKDSEVCTCWESTCIFSEKEEYGEWILYFRVQNNSCSEERKKKKLRHERGLSRWGACRTSLSFSSCPWKACSISISQFWPLLQAVCQNGRGSLEWDREVTFEREHLSQGNKRKARAKRCNRDGGARWWTVFPLCTHFAWEKATQQPPVPLAGWWMERSPRPSQERPWKRRAWWL